MNRGGTTRERHLSQSLSGHQTGVRRPRLSGVLFKPMTLLALVMIGIFSFGALIVLGGFAKDLRKTPPGQATPRSVSAVGYQALTDYLQRLNYDVDETRGQREYYDRKNRLVLYTPSYPRSRTQKRLKKAGIETQLIVLPKWSVKQFIPSKGEEGRSDWARKNRGDGLIYTSTFKSVLNNMPVVKQHSEPSPDAQVHFTTPSQRALPNVLSPDFNDLQYFDLETRWTDQLDVLRLLREAQNEERRRKQAEEAGREYKPKKRKSDKKDKVDKAPKDKAAEEPLPLHEIILKIDGRPVLIRLDGTKTYVLSEPDLLNTMAFNTQSGAQLAGAIIDEIIRIESLENHAVDFDVSLHGIEANRNIIKLMVTPPFLAATLCLLAAGGLVAWQGFNRFGDPTRLRPDYAQGPVSLAQTAAEFMAIANRAHKTGADYAALIRRNVTQTLGFSDRSSEHIDALLQAREKRLNISPTYAELEHALQDVDPQAYAHYAQELARWRDAMTRSDLLPDKTALKEDPSA